jgi:hypothetical protein
MSILDTDDLNNGLEPIRFINGILGTTTNDNPPAGGIGQIIEATITSDFVGGTTLSTPFDITGLSLSNLSAGEWLMYASVSFRITASALGSGPFVELLLTDSSNNVIRGSRGCMTQVANVPCQEELIIIPFPVRISSPTTYKLRAIPTGGGTFTAVNVIATANAPAILGARKVR